MPIQVVVLFPSTPKVHKPIVIIINEASASASEIFSGAMQDYKLATIVGHKSFGKGMVQNVIPLPNETGINLTIAKYLTPLNHDINKKGITPNIIIDTGDFSLDEKKDKQLIKAKSVLIELINKNKSLRVSNNM